MGTRSLTALAVLLLALGGCERAPPTPAPAEAPAPIEPDDSAQARPSFVNRVWAIDEATGTETGALRVFLADGTLVMTSPGATPAFGSWRYADGRLTIVEEGLEYPTEILELGEDRFRIRMLSPGDPVEIRFEPAQQPRPDAVAGAGSAPSTPAATAPAASPPAEAADTRPATVALLGTAWRLERLNGAAVQRGTQPTLEFPIEGRASGNGSCNRFNGIVSIQDGAIMFGGVAATRKACPQAVMGQEEAYLSALRESVRFEADAESLTIHSAGREEPLRFVPGPAPAAAPAQGIGTAPAATPSALAGLWTIVGHHVPGVAAMTDEEARRRHGETLRLTGQAAVSSPDRCAEPRYSTRQVPAASYLAEQFRLAPGSLAPLAARNQLRILEVSCAGSPWTALGATLIEVDRDRALAPRDGVFFELARDRDFRAVGQDPGWQLEVRKGSEMRFTYDHGKGSAVTPAPRTQLDPRTGTRTLHARTEASDLKVEIVPVACSDAASGRPFPSTVTVTLDGRAFRGCGENLATPYQG
jgi:heat shock protein HslJ/uncharacterized membrane protein